MEEFRNRLDIPVGVADIDMAQVGGKLRHFSPHVEARPVPFDEPTSRETVTKLLKPWPTTGAATLTNSATSGVFCVCANDDATTNSKPIKTKGRIGPPRMWCSLNLPELEILS